MTQDLPAPVTRRHAAVAAALSGAAVVVLGYASGWGLSLPVAGSAVGAGTPAGPVAAPAVTPPVVAVPVALTHHYVASGPTAMPTTSTTQPVQPTPPPPTTGSTGSTGGPGGSGTPTGSPSGSGSGGGGGSTSGCTGLRPALTALVRHIDSGHLEESPTQQIADLLDLGQYTTTHTTLLESLLQPLLGGVSSDLDVLLQHIEAGHLEESPTQQVQDLLSTDQYVKTHTVLIENLLKPLVGDRSC